MSVVTESAIDAFLAREAEFASNGDIERLRDAFRDLMGDVDDVVRLSRPAIMDRRALVFFETLGPGGSSVGYVACERGESGWQAIERFVLGWGCR